MSALMAAAHRGALGSLEALLAAGARLASMLCLNTRSAAAQPGQPLTVGNERRAQERRP